jgi:nucleolar complex protein 2
METDGTLVTKELLTQWKKSMLTHHSMKAVRKVVSAFKSSIPNEEDTSSFRIDDLAVYNLLLMTTVKYAPMVFDHQLERSLSEK